MSFSLKITITQFLPKYARNLLLDFISKSTYNYVHMEIKYTPLISESAVPFFTRQNLEVILGSSRRTLDYRIKSLIIKGILTRLKSGMYLNAALLKTTPKPEELMRYIACQVVPNSYISLAYALASYGILVENIYTITCITTKKTRKFETNTIRLSYRNIKPSLYMGFTAKKYESFSYPMATPAKALFDYFYLTPFATRNDLNEFIVNSRINWDILTKEDKKELKNIVQTSASQKMNTILQFLMTKDIV